MEERYHIRQYCWVVSTPPPLHAGRGRTNESGAHLSATACLLPGRAPCRFSGATAFLFFCEMI